MGTPERTVPSFELLDDIGIEVVDPVEHRRLLLHVSSVSDFETECDNPFHVPVETVASFRTERIRLREAVGVVVRDGCGEMVSQVQPLTEAAFDNGEHQIELNGTIKVCFHLVGPMRIAASIEEISIEFPRQCRVAIGARSYHRQPATTITTSDDHEAMAEALSFLGSALKTTSPERAFPTLRGHPPAIELGDELRIPTSLTRLDSGVSIEVPPEYRFLFTIAPLAYYLAADVGIGDRPRITTDTGYVHELRGPTGGVEREVERVLKQAFLLDCVTRTEGIYRIPLHERAAIESEVDLDFAWLYDQRLARRLEAYLEVPFETIEDHAPTWNLIAHVPPTPDRIEVLPYVIDNLAIVRSTDARTLSSTEARDAALSAYVDHTTRSSPSVPPRRSGRSTGDDWEDERIVRLEETDSMEDAWFGEFAPLNATKALLPAYRNRFDRARSEFPISIAVVCNASGLEVESDIADSIYRSREEFPFEVTHYRNLTVEELRSVLTTELDFLHYIGHTTDDGFHCRNGQLDAATLEDVGVGMFFLNSCRSYRHGVHLVEAGSIGGVVTVSDVNDEGAAIVGRTMAKLLNRGFPLRAAVQLAARASVVGGHYIVIGDGIADLVSPANGLPIACRLAEADDRHYDVTLRVFLPREGGMGTTVYPLLATNDQQFLAPGTVTTFRVSESELLDHLAEDPIPVLYQGDLLLSEYSDHIRS
jgi:hypothetical protein